MKKYAMVDTEKSTRIFIRALTWFLRRTVPSSRNAKPACIARTRIAPSRMNRTSDDVFRPSMFSSSVFSYGEDSAPGPSGSARCLDPFLRGILRPGPGLRRGRRIVEEGHGSPLAEVIHEEALHDLHLLVVH